MEGLSARVRIQLTQARRPLRMAGIVTACALIGTCSQPPPLLEQIRTLGELRVVTRNSPTAYYLSADGPDGPEYELAGKFAERLGVKLVVQVAAGPDAALEEVRRGRAHLAAAGLVVSDRAVEGIEYGPAYQHLRQFIVYRVQSRMPRTPADLVGKRIEVAPGSGEAIVLAGLAASNPGLKWKEVPVHDPLDLLARVANGQADYTVADTNEFSLARHLLPDLRTAFEVPRKESIAWALTDRDQSLMPLVRAYFASLEASGQLAAILERHYTSAPQFDYVDSLNFVRHVRERLSMLRPWFEEAAREIGEDWRLLAAVGYQESKWDAAAVSPTGVRGVMMLTEQAAARVGITDRADARQSILGGARYLVHVREMVPDRIAERDRTWLALAGYNVGFGHLEDARILAQRDGRNPDAWADVRRYLPLLAQERYYMQTKRGYARGWEPVQFVDSVRNYLEVLEWMTGAPENEVRLADTQQRQVRPDKTDSRDRRR